MTPLSKSEDNKRKKINDLIAIYNKYHEDDIDEEYQDVKHELTAFMKSNENKREKSYYASSDLCDYYIINEFDGLQRSENGFEFVHLGYGAIGVSKNSELISNSYITRPNLSYEEIKKLIDENIVADNKSNEK